MSARQARRELAEGADQSRAGRCAECGVLVRIFRPARSMPAQRPMSPGTSPTLVPEGVPIGIEISTVASVYRGHSPSGIEKNDQRVLPCSAPLAPIRIHARAATSIGGTSSDHRRRQKEPRCIVEARRYGELIEMSKPSIFHENEQSKSFGYSE